MAAPLPAAGPAMVSLDFSKAEVERLKNAVGVENRARVGTHQYKKADLEKFKALVSVALPGSEQKENADWKDSSALQKVGYAVDFFKWGQNAQNHAKIKADGALFDKLKNAIG